MITDDERRLRLANRQLLVPRLRTDDVTEIADALVALHSSDPVTVYLSVLARMRTPDRAVVESALYQARSLIRHHAMRRTLWVATPETVRLMNAAATTVLLGPERRRLLSMLAVAGVADPEAWLTDAEDVLVADLAEYGPTTARDLGLRHPELARPMQLSPGTSYAAKQSAHTRVLLGLGFQGRILRARPTGGWSNGAYRYAAASDWLPGGLGDQDPAPAAAELADRWLRRFGPATTADLQWWMGWTLKTTRQALGDSGAVECELSDGVGWLSSADESVAGAGADDSVAGAGAVDRSGAEPWVAALPSLDPTTMGWKRRDWYLPEVAAEAFDRNGNAGPTLWVDGRVVGAWAVTENGEIRSHYFERVAPARRAELTDRLAELSRWVGGVGFTVRFPGRIQASILR